MAKARSRTGLRWPNGCLAIAVTLFGVAAFSIITGWFRVDTVLTGSMEPAILPGDVVILTSEPVAALRVGQIVAFHPPSELSVTVVHRVVEVARDHGSIVIRTKGDANTAMDPWHLQIIGTSVWRVSLVVPKIGFLLLWASSGAARFVVVLGCISVGVWLIVDYLRRQRRTPSPDDPSAHADSALNPPPDTGLGVSRPARQRTGRTGSSSKRRRRSSTLKPLVAFPLTLVTSGVLMMTVGATPWGAVATSPTETLQTTNVSAPTGLTGTGSCSGSPAQSNVTLTWNASVLRDYDNGYLVTGYTALRSTASLGPYTAVGTTSGSPPPNTFTDTNITGFPTPTVFVSDSAGTVESVNGSTYTTTPITTGTQSSEPNDIAITPDGSKVVVANEASGTVSVITTATNAVQTITIPSGGLLSPAAPNAVVITPDGNTAYVSDHNNAVVYPISIAGATATLGTGITVGTLTDPTAMVMLPNGSDVYVANYTSGTVSAISTASNTVVATIPVNGGSGSPEALAVTPDSAHVYVADQKDNAIWDIASASNTISGPIAIGNLADTNLLLFTVSDPNILSITPNGANLFVANVSSGTVSVIATATDTVTSTIILPAGAKPNGLLMPPNGCQFYVADAANDAIDVVGVSTDAFVTAVPVGTLGDPMAMSVTPDSARIFVANRSSGTVSVISAGTDTVIATIGGISSPAGIAITPYPLYYEVEATRDLWISPPSTSFEIAPGWNPGGWQ